MFVMRRQVHDVRRRRHEVIIVESPSLPRSVADHFQPHGGSVTVRPFHRQVVVCRRLWKVSRVKFVVYYITGCRFDKYKPAKFGTDTRGLCRAKNWCFVIASHLNSTYLHDPAVKKAYLGKSLNIFFILQKSESGRARAVAFFHKKG